MSRAAPLVAAACVALVLLPVRQAAAETAVAIELVLAVDTSLSVDNREYGLQMTGIAEAFRHPEIIDLIGQRDGVAVTLFQWSSKVDPRYRTPWRVLHGPPSVLAFAAEVEALAREPSRGFTALGSALEFALVELARNRFAGRERKIDVSADGRSNSGPLPAGARALAGGAGIAINGLPILVDTYGLDEYFRREVIAGPGAFVEIATDYDDFAKAFLRKLRRELTPLISFRDPPRRRPQARPAIDLGHSASDHGPANRR